MVLGLLAPACICKGFLDQLNKMNCQLNEMIRVCAAQSSQCSARYTARSDYLHSSKVQQRRTQPDAQWVVMIVLTKQRKCRLCPIHKQRYISFLLELSQVLEPLGVSKPVKGHIWGHASPVKYTAL